MISDRDWITANPHRQLRIRASTVEESGLAGGPEIRHTKAATVIEISGNRRTWLTTYILLVGEIIDTDIAAEFARDYYEGFMLVSRLPHPILGVLETVQ